jgi:hypothetical protein
MAEVVNQKTEIAKPQPGDSFSHTLTIFAQSLAYSAAEAPARGGAQLVDQIFGTGIDDTIQSNLAQIGIHKPEEARYGTAAWSAEQLGSAIGMVVPMWLSRKVMVDGVEKALVKVGASEGHFAQLAAMDDKALREAKLSARTGLFYGAVLSPTENKENSSDFWAGRAKQSINGFATFGTMGYSSSLTGSLLGRAADSLESTALPFKSPLQTALHSNLVHGAISGVPGGAIQAQINAMESGKPLPSLQDLKENIVSMTMAGGVMGSAGLFKEAPSKSSAKINVEAKPLDITTPIIQVSEHPITSLREAPNPFDIKFDPVVKAFTPDFVTPHMTVETRPIDFTPPNRDALVGKSAWNKFEEWGVDKREIPVNVYRFPGVATEILVPSDYAAHLDNVRLQRLNDPTTSADATNPYRNRILPEEILQVLDQLPQPDLVKSIELLDHASPWDLARTHNREIEAKQKGEEPPTQDFVSMAEANTEKGIMRFFDVSTHNEAEMQEAAAHEWAHLVEGNAAHKAFDQAAHAERNGFFVRKYAHENNRENWAVHLGERFLNPEGPAFSELPEKAPARTLVMAKAVRNMLESRKDAPSSRHDEFLRRVEAADHLATTNLQKGMLADMASGDMAAIADKLKFLNIAATDGRSPELSAKVLSPIKDQLKPLGEALGIDGRSARMAYTESAMIEQMQIYSPERMPRLVKLWRSFGDAEAQARMFQVLPEEGQKYLLNDLSSDESKGARAMLQRLGEITGPTQVLAQETYKTIEQNHTKEALNLHRANKPIPDKYFDWLENWPEPEAKLAALQNKSSAVSAAYYKDLTAHLQAPAQIEMIVGDAMSYIKPDERAGAWADVLEKMSQDQQVKLFRQLAQYHNPNYSTMANIVEHMNATDFGAQSKQIQLASLEIMEYRESKPEFIAAHPRLIKDAKTFLKAADSLDSNQIAGLIKDGVLTNFSRDGVDKIVHTFSEKLDARTQLDILEAIPASVESQTRINVLAKLARETDPVASAKAERLLMNVASEQLEALHQTKDSYSRLSSNVLDRTLLALDDARSRAIYLESLPRDSDGHLASQKMTLATIGLSEPQLLQVLRSGVVDLLSPADKIKFLEGAFWGRSRAIKDQLRSMTDLSHLARF